MMIFLDAQSKRGKYRITSFEDSIEAVARQYQDWVRQCGLAQKQIWYANIFECKNDQHIGYLEIGTEEEIRVYPVQNSKLNPYRRSLKQLLHYFI